MSVEALMHLSQLAIYPVKSCGQVPLQQSLISPFGLEMDRRWMIVDEQGMMLTQRKHARMCLITPLLEDSRLRLEAPGMPVLWIDNANMTPTRATVWNDSCQAMDCGDDAAHWLSQFMDKPVRLVFFPENEVRQCDLRYARQGDITAFSDGFPYLLISQASLDDLNSRLEAPVEMKRFRPNLVISGSAPFAEDDWKRIRIGDTHFRLVKPCSRCVIPSIDPASGEKSPEPTRTLAGYRRRDNKIFFGQNVVAEGSGQLEIGMPVEILE